jgi:hypothetical protein
MSSSRNKTAAVSTAVDHHHVAQPDEHDPPKVEDVGSSPIVVASIGESRRDGLPAVLKTVAPSGWGFDSSALRQIKLSYALF